MSADFEDLIESFASEFPVTLRRTAVGTTDHGRYTPGGTTNTDIVAVVIRGPGEAAELLNETERTKETIKVFTSTPLFPVGAPNGQIADKILYRGEVYEVQQVSDWEDSGNYYRALATKVAQ